MASNFCTSCGFPRQHGSRFCAGCGVQFNDKRVCPTCGQDWPESGVAANPRAAASGGAAQGQGVQQPGFVYGPGFNAATDCANCGNPGGKESCSICQS